HEVTANENAPLVDMLSTQQGRDFLDQHLAYMVSIGQLTESRREALNRIVAALPEAGTSGSTKFRAPESVNLEFQTGLRKGTLLFGNVRWVH
ncbi:long-chain fatty acid transporter, partial [Acinetobacter sp. 11520]|nr:long-chain fatty acid transporter [Acinetobacter sp. 11520]